MDPNKTWFDNYKLGPYTLKNRILMAPLTRMRCNKQTGVANELLAKYYKQRASFGLIITESSPISQRGNSFLGSAGIYTKEQTQGWKKVVNEVHSEGGLICLQLWHCGRAMPQGILPKDMQCWGASQIQARDLDMINNAYFEMPHAMTKNEIDLVKQEFRKGAENAKSAGFDMIMLHAGNGYLIDQFLKNQTNKRTDEYGGSIQNRCRLALEILDELILIFGKDRTGIRISPIDKFNDMFDSNPFALFSYFVKQIDEKGIGFLEIKETAGAKSWDCKSSSEGQQYDVDAQNITDCCKAFKPFFSRTIINNESLDKESGLKKIQEGICDLVSFGTLAIANPDLPYRFKNNCQFASADPKYFFEGGEIGYIDYPNYEFLN